MSGTQKNTATVAEANKLVSLRAILRLGNYGIFFQSPSGGQPQPIAEATVVEPAILLIKRVDRERPEDSASVDASDDYINVGVTWDTIYRASYVADGLRNMIASEIPGITLSEQDARIDGLPGVSPVWNKAVAAAVKAL